MTWVAIITAICLLAGILSTKFLGKDNPIEETVEDLIEIETGEKIDLSLDRSKIA